MPFVNSANESEQPDVDLYFPSARYPVTVGPVMRTRKWRGGVFVQYITSTLWDWTVEISDGNFAAGCILFPSENYALSPPYGTGPGSNANWTSGQPGTGVGGQNVVTMFADNTRAMFKVYETRRLVAGLRTGAPITYVLNEDVKVSENGILCNDSDVDLLTVGITTPQTVGIVSALPATRTNNRLGVDVRF